MSATLSAPFASTSSATTRPLVGQPTSSFWAADPAAPPASPGSTSSTSPYAMKPFSSPNHSSSVNTSSRSRSPSPKSPTAPVEYSDKSSVSKSLFNLNLNRTWPAPDPFASSRASISHGSDATSMSVDSFPPSLREASVSSAATVASQGPHSPDGSALRTRRLPSIAQLDLPKHFSHELGRRYSLQPSNSQQLFTSNVPRPSLSHASTGAWPARENSPPDAEAARPSYTYFPAPRKDVGGGGGGSGGGGDDLYRLAARASRVRDASMGSPSLRSDSELGLHDRRGSNWSMDHKRKAPEPASGPSWGELEDRYGRSSHSRRRLSPTSNFDDGDSQRRSHARSSSVEARSRRGSQSEVDTRAMWGQQIHAVPGFQEGWSARGGRSGGSNAERPSAESGSPRSGPRMHVPEHPDLPPPFFPGLGNSASGSGSLASRPAYPHRHSIASDAALERREPHTYPHHGQGRASYYAARPSGSSISMGRSGSYGGQGDSDDGLYNGDDGRFLPDAAAVPARKRGKLPKETTELLRTWLLQHAHHPYPSEDEKRDLCRATQLSMSQICNWFINARRRILAPKP